MNEKILDAVTEKLHAKLKARRWDFDLTYHIRINLKGYYSPERPKPDCNDPDDPRYHDDGDQEECNIAKIEVEMIDGEELPKVILDDIKDRLENSDELTEYVCERERPVE